ncbi:type VII secretion target [Amycolatopsis sp. 195334CR]|uniref:type VII secretion target n=1 Tax=Amycolatopsis sp. 195334CR TaxID=2814588 RepID=UPI001A8EE93A|nr:type VII secretion target [Amycolatopsis sp. 195334CR]MBN6039653.1 ESX-1 secretion-associated protein [Amycolatopsis sp. 195334CR]
MNPVLVDPDRIRAHASTADGVAAEVSTVAAALPGGLDSAAFGTFTQFLTEGLREVLDRTAGAISHASAAVDSMSTRLGQAADGYQSTDGDGVTRVRAAEN